MQINMLYLLKSKIPTEISITETRQNTSCGWFYPAANSVPASGYELHLSRVPTAGYKLRLIPSYGWLGFQWLDKSCGWLRPAADSSSGGLIRVAADSILRLTRVLYFNMSSKFKDLFWKIHRFYGLFSNDWFQLPLIQALAAASKSLRKLEEASRL